MNIFVFILVSASIYAFIVYTQSLGAAPQPTQIVYKTVQEKEYDKAFSEENFPSRVFADMFSTQSIR
jgi:hypothetical protein